MNQKAYEIIDGVDIILFLTDATKSFSKGDEIILSKLKNKEANVFLLLNKVDQIKDKSILLEKINKLKDLYDFKEIIPISALKNDNVKELISCIKKYLPERDKLYTDEDLTNVSTKFILAEYLREKILELTRDEIPHTVTCYVENYEEDEKIIHVQIVIVVDRENLKKIIIGKNGRMLKEIGTRARKDMEEFLGKQVFLETHVKTLKNWRDEEKYFSDLGLKEDI